VEGPWLQPSRPRANALSRARRIAISLVILASAIVMLAGATLAFHDSSHRRGGGPISQQSYVSQQEPVTTSNLDWADIEGLKRRTSCPADDSSSAILSLELTATSSPVDVRIAMDDPLVSCPKCTQPALMTPKDVQFTSQSNSFTFVEDSAIGSHGTIYRAQWRLSEEGSATLENATLNVIWAKSIERCR
jgi:hypothetical protein